jgi:uncharacterized protein RhaS with RHS repeats
VISWHRFYDPETGRYISADPIGLVGGMNLYAYVGGNPVNFIDPMGLEACSCSCSNCTDPKLVEVKKRTGETDPETTYYWDVIAAAYAKQALAAAVATLPSMPPMPNEVVIGRIDYRVGWATFECWVEICLDNMQRFETGCRRKKGPTEWEITGSDDITRIFYY